MNPVEVALVAFRDALDAEALARLRLEEKVRDAFPAERAMVAHGKALLQAAKNELAAAIGANGPLLSAPVLRYGFKKEGANADRT